MKTVFSYFLIVFLIPNLMAQEDAGTSHTKEIGVNFSRFLDEAIDFGGTQTILDPYVFTLKKLDNTGKGFRLGAGFNFNRSKGDDGSGNFFTDDPASGFFSLDIRLGSEKQRKLSKSWVCYYGFDWVLEFDYSELRTRSDFNGENVKIVDTAFGFGLGPALGGQFMISERVGIAAEASFYLVQNFQKEKTKFDNSLSTDEERKFNSTRLNFNVPANVYIFFRL